MAAVGGIIAFLGLLLTSFTNSLYVIYLTYSVLWGFGSSLNYAPTMLVLGKLKVSHVNKSYYDTLMNKHLNIPLILLMATLTAIYHNDFLNISNYFQ